MLVQTFKLDSFKEKHLKPVTEKEVREQTQRDIDEVEQIDRLSDAESDDLVIQIESSKEKAQKALEDDLLNFLDEGGSQTTYRDKLAVLGLIKLKSVEFSKGWEYFCLPTREGSDLRVGGKNFKTKAGVVIILKAPDETTYTRAMGVTYDPVIDHGAITTLVIQAENTYDRHRGFSTASAPVLSPTVPEGHVKTESGIYIK